MDAQTDKCSPLDRLLLDKLGFTKKTVEEVRLQVASGKYPIDRIYHVEGEMTIGDDYMTTPTVNIPIKATLAVLLQLMGFQRAKGLAIIRQAVTEAVLHRQKAEETLPVVENMLENLQNDLIKQLPKTLRKGAVNVDATVTRCDRPKRQAYGSVLYAPHPAQKSRKKAVKV